jgi:hypothetical protein
LKRVSLYSSLGLLLIGGALLVTGLPYAISHYACGIWCEGVSVGSGATIAHILSHHDVFELFMPYGLVVFVIGLLLYFAYRVELKEMSHH